MQTQCRLERDGNIQTAWIDKRGARIGAKVALKEDNDQFWEVTAVYNTLPDEVVKQNERNYKTHRKGTDI